jgi:hemoglobin-like flavoprotein
MNTKQITVVKESWAKVAPIAPPAATLFYDRLFSVAPGARNLFPADMTEQKRKLMEMLATVVDRLDALEEIVPEVQALGERHAGYGAEPEHYAVVGECLLWTLGQGPGDGFTAEVKDAWATAYETLASTMIDAQRNAENESSLLKRRALLRQHDHSSRDLKAVPVMPQQLRLLALGVEIERAAGVGVDRDRDAFH